MKETVYLIPLVKSFESNANEKEALLMSRYMKNLFPFYGIKSPLRRNLQKKFHNDYGYPDLPELKQVIEQLWKLEQREFQYFAMELLGRFQKKVDPSYITFYEFLITNKSWWDSVDYLAANPLGVYFKKFPDEIIPYTSRWMNSGNFWLQRSLLLFQLKYKSETDTELLFSIIEKLKDEKEFFIRKAIGWALREYSKTSPEKVADFIIRTKLSALSHREASKYISDILS